MPERHHLMKWFIWKKSAHKKLKCHLDKFTVKVTDTTAGKGGDLQAG